MEAWSDLPIDNFKVKFFLDTNILVFLIDGTYVGLTHTINKFNELGFVDLISSNFVIFEFCGVRKKEHFLRLALNNLSTPNGNINVSSLLNYKDGYNIDDVDFAGLKDDIKEKVEKEFEKITNDFNIVYSGNILHDELLKPTFDICLSSKISKEDTLVLVSALLPEGSKPEECINFITKDNQFIQSYTEAYRDFDLETLIDSHNLCSPGMFWIQKIEMISGDFVNLTSSQDLARLNDFLPSKLFEMICDKNDDLILGRIFAPNNVGFPQDVICFKLRPNKELPVDPFLTIISKDLSFIYTSKVRITEFWQNNNVLALPYITADDDQNNIAFKMLDEDRNVLPQNIIDCLKEEGNMVFIHPDS